MLTSRVSGGLAINLTVASRTVPEDSRVRPLPLEHTTVPYLSTRRAANRFTNIRFIPLSRTRPRLRPIGATAPGIPKICVRAPREQELCRNQFHTKKNKELLFKNDKQMTKSAEQNKKESQQFHTSIVMNQ